MTPSLKVTGKENFLQKILMERFDIREGLNLVFDDVNPKDGGTTTLELSVRRNVNETNGISWIVGHYRNYRIDVLPPLKEGDSSYR